jgi:hypothetical protein
VSEGEPILDPPPRLIRVRRLDLRDDVTVDSSDDWLLKAPVVDLLRELSAIQNGTVARLEFRHGLPCLLELALSPKVAESDAQKSL